MKKLKRTALLVSIVSLVSLNAITIDEKGDTNPALNLRSLVMSANADCELPPVYPLPAAPCRKIWCQSTMSYYGCGTGNGNTCTTMKSCP